MKQMFDLHCESCDKYYSDLIDLKKLPEIKCEHCGIIGKLARLYSEPPNVHYKGSGYYTTDYKDKKGNK